MNYLLAIRLCLLLFPLLATAQTPADPSVFFQCASSEALQLHPELQILQQHIEEEIIARNDLHTAAKGQSLPYVIPVVVHIIHDNGPENISDAQVYAALEHLNQAYAHTDYFDQSNVGVPTQIQFCLARRDPDGQATTGITRNTSPLTDLTLETDDIKVKDLNRWNPKEYVNIWVVREISSVSAGPGVAGYAFFPSSHGRAEDGMVCEARYFGVGPAEDAVLIHEMGHYFGLYHTFEGGCPNDNCQVQGDRVCDTPPDRATHTSCVYNSCATDIAPNSPFTSDIDDFTGDFMDYSPFSCYRFFTAGQAMRMQGAVATTRKSLTASKGCLEPCTAPITAHFSVQPNPPVATFPAQFIHQSTGGSSFSWSENGVEFSQEENPSLVFSSVGNHLISLTVSNSDPNCSETKEIPIDVICPIRAGFSAAQMVSPAGSTLTFSNTSGGANGLSYQWSIDGQLVSSATNLSYLFQNPGVYSVELKASGALCSSDTSAGVLITGPCGQIPEPVQLSFTGSKKVFDPRDLLPLSDGSILQCGAHNFRPMVTKWDALGHVVWHKVLTNDGSFDQIETLPDSNFLLIGDLDLKMVVAKMDWNGNLLWVKTIENTGSSYYHGSELSRMAAVNPDGSFGVYYNDNYAPKHYLLKISSNGDLLWSKRFNQIGSTASLRLATDGSGDFLLLSAGTFMTTSFTTSVFRINQNGQGAGIQIFNYPNEDLLFISNLELATHPDGGYSIFFVTNPITPGQPVNKYLMRVSASGAVIWSKKYEPGSSALLQAAFMRPLPQDKGWLMVDSRTDLNDVATGNFLQYLNSDGEIVWERKWSEPSNYTPWVLVPTWQSGRIRGLSTEVYHLDMKLVNFPESKLPLTCLPLLQPNTNIDDVFTYGSPMGLFTNPAGLQLSPLSVLFAGDNLSSSTICTAILPCQEICDNQVDDDGDFLVDCIDDDCNCAPIDTPECVSDPTTPEIAMKLGWESNNGQKIFDTSVPLVANLNPQTDSIPEILITGWTEVTSEAAIYFFKGDGADFDSPKRLKPEGLLAWQGPSQFAVADLNNDGIPEVIALCQDKKIRIYSQFDPATDPPMQLWATSAETTIYTEGALSTADFDSDGIPEIYIGAQIFQLSLNPPGLHLVLTGNKDDGYSSAGTDWVSTVAADVLSAADCPGDPDCNGLELVAGRSVYSVDLSTSDGDGLQIKEKINLNQADPSNVNYFDGISTVADINLDGKPDIITTTDYLSGGKETNGVAIWNRQGLQRFYPINHISGFYGFGGTVLIANVFDDRKAGFLKDMPEILVVGQYELSCLNENKASRTPQSPWWWTIPVEEQSGRTIASAFDFNGDGRLEIVYRDERSLKILYGGPAPYPFGVDANRQWTSFPTVSLTGDEYPVVADLDHDQQAEIVVGGYTTLSGTNNVARLRVFESAAKPWAPARALWNQYNYFNVNINDDLSVPAVQQKHWLEAPVTGSEKRPFNTFLVQGPAPDSLVSTRILTPDALVSVASVACRTDSFDLQLNICNSGSAALPAGTPVTFYLGDPTAGAAPVLFPPVLLPEVLDQGGCNTFKLAIPATYDATIFVVVNDDGHVQRPFNLSADFPATDQPECRYVNNMTSFSFSKPTPTLDLGSDISLCQNSVIELSAGAGFMQYRWQDGSQAAHFTAFSPGKYWVEAVDACGFKQSDTLEIILNTLAILDLPEEISVCRGDSIQLSASGFSTYRWSPADSLSCEDCVEVTVHARNSSTIFLTASEGNCFVTDSVQIRVVPNPQLSLQVQDGDCDTPARIAALTDGTALLWSNGSSESVIYPAQAGLYSVVVTNAGGCSTTGSASVQIIQQDLTIHFEANPIPCEGGSGSILATGEGGSGQYSFTWSTGELSDSIAVMLPGKYVLTLLDVSGTGCQVTDTVEVTTRGGLHLDAKADMVRCFGGMDGTAYAFAVDGRTPYSWSWQGGQTAPLLNNLPTGTYTVTITDAIGCTGVREVIITEPPLLLAGAQAADTLICPNEVTEVVATATGGTPPYQYWWNNGQSDSLLTMVQPGNYTLTVTDKNACTATASVFVGSAPGLSVALDSVLHATGPTNSDGGVLAHITAGEGPFSFLWNTGDSTLNLINIAPGNYTLTVTDGNGCTQTLSAVVDFMSSVPAILRGWEVFLQPNPVQSGASARLAVMSPDYQQIDFQLFDALGNLLKKDRFDLTANQFQRSILAPTQAGMYFLILSNGREWKCLKWVVID